MALDGMEEIIKKYNKRGMKLNFIRYADDFCVTAEHRETLKDIILPELNLFLKVRGLKLSDEKTKIVNIEEGFDFLGQTLRKFKGNKLITQPSSESIKSHMDKVRSTVRSCRGKNAEVLINRLNPVIRGWSYYHRFVQSGKTFYNCQSQTNLYLMKWARRTHSHKTPRWLRNHYWGKSKDERRFSCYTKKGESSYLLTLTYHPDIDLARYIKIRGTANPYLRKDKEYFVMRDNCANSRKLESRKILPLIYS
jgi:RNA-directed DNA polymerase